MGKTYIDAVKYNIYAHFEVDGMVDKSDVVGAIFGQTEGLLGEELNLRDLQRNGRIGRIEVETTTTHGRTIGSIIVPSSLDMVETAVIASALETVDRVGPHEAKIVIEKIEDNRTLKRKKVIDKAKELLKNMLETQIPDSREITELVRKEVRSAELIFYGEDKLPAGPSIDLSDSIILVEGRADVINLLKNDVTNVISIGGARVPKSIIELSKRKEITVFLDGDRGGNIILKELLNAGVEIDFVTRAPTGKEVEELTRKEIIKALRSKVPLEQYNIPSRNNHTNKKNFLKEKPKEREKPVREVKEVKKEEKPKDMKEEKPKKKVEISEEEMEKILSKELATMRGTLNAKFYGEGMDLLKEIPIKDIISTLRNSDNVCAIVFDGIITQRLVDLAKEKNVKYVVGIRVGNVKNNKEGIKIITG